MFSSSAAFEILAMIHILQVSLFQKGQDTSFAQFGQCGGQ